jgi:hypothetical protein
VIHLIAAIAAALLLSCGGPPPEPVCPNVFFVPLNCGAMGVVYE